MVGPILLKHNAILADEGSLDWMFSKKGVIRLEQNKEKIEELQLEIIEAGAEDIRYDEEIEIHVPVTNLNIMKKKLQWRVKHSAWNTITLVIRKFQRKRLKIEVYYTVFIFFPFENAWIFKLPSVVPKPSIPNLLP